MYIIVKGKSSNKDILHHRRRYIESSLKETIFSKEKMDQRDCHDTDQENKRVADYDKWKSTKGQDGTTNEQKMTEWSNINREFKKMGLEGKPHSIDDIRKPKTVKYD